MVFVKCNILKWYFILLFIRDTASFVGSFTRVSSDRRRSTLQKHYTATLSEIVTAGSANYSKVSNAIDLNTDRLSIFKTDGEYVGEKLDDYFNSKPLLVWERLVDIGSPLLGWWMLKKFNNVTAQFRTAEENSERKKSLAIDLKDSIVQTKSVTIIKSGQALALRPDLIKSPDYIRELTKLQDEVGTFRNDLAMQIIREELNQEPSEVYDFDPILPIASASIGQVYKAKLRSTGQTVAVKVQRPDAIEYAALDMFILRKGAALLRKRFKLRSNLVGIVDVFGSQLFKELDYEQEARNCLRFKEMYGTIPNIYVPDAYLNLTTTRVLTMEFVEGVKGPWAVGGERMLTLGLQCSVFQLLGTGYFHSDPHRGNLLQSPTGDLVYLDFGMMSEVPADQRFALIGTVIGLVNKDISLVIQNLKKLDFFPPETNEELVVSALTAAVMNATEDGEGSSLNFTKLSRNIDSISNILPFRLPPFYSFIIRTLTILEGLALYVDPSFRLIKGAYPFVAKQMLSAPSAEMSGLLKSVLINAGDGSIRWEKLEQFISIASNADAAISGDFQALKKAQERSDLAKLYAGQQKQGNVTLNVTLQIFDFLVSENGRFLFDPLVNEIVETIEALGLTALTITSIATSGLIPPPNEKPDKKKVQLFFKLMGTILDRVDGPDSGSKIRNARPYTFDKVSSHTALDLKGGGGVTLDSGQSVLDEEFEDTDDTRRKVLRAAFVFISNLLQIPTGNIASLQPLVNRSSVLVQAVVSKLLERGARRVVRSVVTPANVGASLPVLGRVIDFVLKPMLSSRK